MPTSLAILFLLITAAWTGIFAIAFARRKSAKKQTMLANCFWIGAPCACILAAIALLLQTPSPGITRVQEQQVHAHDSLSEHKQECIRDAISPRIAAERRAALVKIPTGASFETATRPTQQR